MVHRLLGLLVAMAAAVVLASCGDDDDASAFPPVEPETFEPATEGTMVRWSEAAGECHECGFSIVFHADGTATYAGHREGATVPFDVADLSERLRRLDRRPITTGSDDCGREVDGAAPVLELTSANGTILEIDDCFRPVDRDHPVMEVVVGTLAEARAAAAGVLVEVTVRGGLCATGECRSTVAFRDDGAVTATLADGSTTTSTLSADDLADLRSLVAAADRDTLVVGSFDGTCPTAYDGSEIVYQIGDVEPFVIATCSDELDPTDPLLTLVDRVRTDVLGG